MRKRYLGDSVYVEHDDYGLILTTNNGQGTRDTIYLEPAVWAALVAYVEGLKKPLCSCGSNAEPTTEGSWDGNPRCPECGMY